MCLTASQTGQYFKLADLEKNPSVKRDFAVAGERMSLG